MAHLDSRALRRHAFRPAAHPLRWLRQALATWRQRQILGALPPERLSDFGISEREARLEAEKPIWDVPRTWLR